MGRKRMTIRFTPDNFKYLRNLAHENGGDLNGEINRIITEIRKGDSPETATPCVTSRVQ